MPLGSLAIFLRSRSKSWKGPYHVVYVNGDDVTLLCPPPAGPSHFRSTAVRPYVPNQPIPPPLPLEAYAEILLPNDDNPATEGGAQGGLRTAPETEIIPIEVNPDHILRKEATKRRQDQSPSELTKIPTIVPINQNNQSGVTQLTLPTPPPIPLSNIWPRCLIYNIRLIRKTSEKHVP